MLAAQAASLAIGAILLSAVGANGIVVVLTAAAMVNIVPVAILVHRF